MGRDSASIVGVIVQERVVDAFLNVGIDNAVVVADDECDALLPLLLLPLLLLLMLLVVVCKVVFETTASTAGTTSIGTTLDGDVCHIRCSTKRNSSCCRV